MKYSDFFDGPYVEKEDITVTFRGKKKRTSIYHLLPKGKQHYSESFGFEWKNFQNTQIDRRNKSKGTLKHFQEMLGGNIKKIHGKTVLEIGSGAGRYTDYLVDYAKRVVTIDPSSAIYSNVALGAENLLIVQGDLFDLPVKRNIFDLVYCRGVLQHTFNPQLAIWQLYQYVKDDGDIIFDIYAKTWRKFFYTSYYLRPFTKRVNRDTFLKILKKIIPPLLWFKIHCLYPLFPNIRYIKEIPDVLLPIFDSTRIFPNYSWDQNVEWSILNSLDTYTPENDIPLSWKEIMSIVSNLPNHKIIFADRDMFRFRIRKLPRV